MCNADQLECEEDTGKRGVFIVIEGLDGSGKTTQANMLSKRLCSKHDVICTAEPSRYKTGRFIRERCLYDEKRLPVEAEALLFAADRVEHVQKEILPALKEGKIVVCDRYLYSTLAYQGSAGLSLDWIRTINAAALQPDLAVFIDMPPERVLERLRRKKSVMETLETQLKVREIYLKFVEKGELAMIDGDRLKEAVAEDLYRKVLGFLKGA
jgi:dTMP kinase